MSAPGEMPFTQHLDELRTVLVRSSIGILLCGILAFAWSNELFELLSYPLSAGFEKPKLIGTGPAEAFIVKLKVALITGIIAACPNTFLQVWFFVAPGLKTEEKKYAIPFVFFTTFFFVSGVLFCFFQVLPFAFSFFETEYKSIGVAATLKIGEYLSFVTKLIFVFGAIFELPVLSFFLTRIGLITHQWLIKYFRIAIVTIFIAAAILTPPDVATQVLLAIPLVVLYGLCILISWLVKRKLDQEEAAEVS